MIQKKYSKILISFISFWLICPLLSCSTAPTKFAKYSTKTHSAKKYHRVKKGQTLYYISKKYNISVKKLMIYNHLSSYTIEIGQKIYKQKGTGNARFGDKKIVSRRGGGRAFGPMPKVWTKKIPKKKKKLALKLILTNLVKNNQVMVLENFSFEKPSTKKAKETVLKVSKGKKPLFVIEDSNANIVKSFLNLTNVKTERADSIYPYGLLNTDCLIITENALEKITEVFAS